ncbi:MAG: endonuclease MutS2, partial [Cyanobacteria bacterium J083]
VAATHLKIPKTKEESIELLNQTKEVYNLEQNLESGWSFQGIKFIGESLERAELGGMLSAKELLEIATTLAGVRRLRRLIESIEEEETVITLRRLVEPIRTYPEIEQEIHHCIDDRAEVADRASPKLGEIRAKIKQLRDRIYKTLQGILQRQSGAIQEAVITQRSERFVIPVKAAQKEAVPGIVHDISNKGSTLYIEPKQVVEIGNQLRQVIRQEKREEEIVLTALTTKIAEVIPDLEQVLAVATTLDLATARARYSYWLEANPPRFIETTASENITLRKLRHPLLVWQEKHESGTPVVPIDVLINSRIKVVAITGPNTGGKTVTLKTMGLAALMAKCGLFIPAKEPVEIPWFEQVLADIGDEQSLQQSLSTFSGHIKRISRIINSESLNNSLVLLDEVGAGTDPAEGSALAIAILKYLANHSQLTIATTHYGELKALKYQDERFENASVEFNDTTLQPTYRLLWGIPGRSNALTIAKRLGLKEEIITSAQKGVGEESEAIDLVISALEAQRREQEDKAQAASKLLEQTERFYSEVSAKASDLKAREAELKLQQEQAMQQAIAEAKAEIAQVVKKLQQGNVTPQQAQQASAELNQIAEIKLPSRKATTAQKPAYLPKIGEKIRIPGLGQTGEVLSLDEATGQLTVRFGLMKTNLSLTEIESLDGKKVQVPAKPKTPTAKKTKQATPKVIPTVRTSKNSLDIRGSRVANAEVDIEKAIAKAVGAGAVVLWIVHGKGTGKLRQGVHAFLQHHPQVDRFELAPQKEGGSGVTIAYLN